MIMFLLVWMVLAKSRPNIIVGDGIIMTKETEKHVVKNDINLNMNIKVPLPNSTVIPNYDECREQESEAYAFEQTFRTVSLEYAKKLVQNLGLSEAHKEHLLASRYAVIHSACNENSKIQCGDPRYFCCSNKANIAYCGLPEKMKYTSKNNELEWRTHGYCITKYDDKYQYGDNKIHLVKTWSSFINYNFAVGVQDARQAPFDNNVNTFISLRKNPGAIYKVKLMNYKNIEKMNLVKIVLAAVSLNTKEIIKRSQMNVNYLTNEDSSYKNCQQLQRTGKRDGWIAIGFKCGNTTTKEINIRFNLDFDENILINDILIFENADTAPKNLLISVPYAPSNEENWLYPSFVTEDKLPEKVDSIVKSTNIKQVTNTKDLDLQRLANKN